MSRLLLVRHGESTWNAAGRWQGQADPPLSPRGEAQARAAAPGLARLLATATPSLPSAGAGGDPAEIPPPASSVACSPLIRARCTATLVAAAAGLAPPTPVAGLEERGAGPWTGLTHAEIDAGWPGARQAGWRPDGFETDASLLTRARAALRAVAAAAGRAPALVVAHEGVIRALERAAGHDDGKLVNLGARWFVVREGTPKPDGPRVATT